MNKIKVCFVCLGNICRSPMAEYIFLDLVKKAHLEENFTIFSRATSRYEIGNDIYPPAKKILLNHHVPFSRHYAKQLTIDEIKQCDYVLTMEEGNNNDIRHLFHLDKVPSNVYLLNSFANKNIPIVDPYYSLDFETTFLDLNFAINAFFEFLKRENRI